MLKLFECIVNKNKSLHEQLVDGRNMVKSYPGRGYVIAREVSPNRYKVYWTANPNANCNGAIKVVA